MPINTTPAINPNVTRSRLILEIASEMCSGGPAERSVPAWFQPKVVLRNTAGGKPLTLFAVSSSEGIFAVAKGEADLAIINPACVLSVAVKGKGMFKEPLPLRAVTVIPSWDQFVFAVRPDSGIERLEDIAIKKPTLKIMMRGALDHTLHHMFDDVAAAAGFSRHDIAAWGGEVQKKGTVPWPHSAAFKALVSGEVDALFDEAAHSWVPQALDAGMRILSLSETTVKTLEDMGYSRAIIPKEAYPKLPSDVLTIDFSGWTVFVREDADDKVVEQICAGIAARNMNIPWEEPGDLPVDRMAKEGVDTPQCVTLHPAAERYWKGRGWL
jgi:TRAP-type uncharacterized transport system substrate-binding protein